MRQTTTSDAELISSNGGGAASMNVELVLWKDQKRECIHCGFLETMIFAGARLILT